jgi:hypothetical protein
MTERPSLQCLLRARQDAHDALERGDMEIEYRGSWIEIEDHERGWRYLLDGDSLGESLEDAFEVIDRRTGSTEEEIERLGEAWIAHLEPVGG